MENTTETIELVNVPKESASQDFIARCPYWPTCQVPVVVCAINCGIFRHGHLKQNWAQIDPHASKAFCDQLALDDAIVGCGKPFRVELDTNSGENSEATGFILRVMPCDYI